MQLTVVDHPLARARLSRMRDERTDNATFRAALRELTQMLVYEATRDLAVAEEPIQTPVTATTGYRLAAPPLIVPVLRAGLGMADTAHGMLPESQMGFVGLARNEVTFQPEAYMASLPESLVGRHVFVLDPMLATGGSLVHCCGLLTERGATRSPCSARWPRPRACAAGGERAAAARLHRQRRRGPQRARPTSSRGSVTRATASSARSDHAVRRPRHGLLGEGGPRRVARRAPRPPSWSASGAATSPRRRRSARSSTSPGYDDVDELLAAGRRRLDRRCRRTCRSPLAERAAAAGKHLLLEKPIALDVAGADRLVDAVRDAGVASVVFFTFRFQAGDVVLAGAGGAHDAGRRARRPGWARSAGQPVRRLALAQGARRALGHRPARAVAVRAGARAGRLGAGRRRPARHRPPGPAHESGVRLAPSRSRTRSPRCRPGIEFFVHGDAGRLVLLPEARTPRREAFAVAVDELTAAAVTGGTHPCDVGFGRDVVAVLGAAARALESGCREIRLTAGIRGRAPPTSPAAAGPARPRPGRARRSGRRPRAPARPSPGRP